MGAKSLEVGPATLAVVALTNRAIEGAGLTRAHIEEAARISHNRLAVILRGERPPTVDELVRICEAVGVSAATTGTRGLGLSGTSTSTSPAPW